MTVSATVKVTALDSGKVNLSESLSGNSLEKKWETSSGSAKEIEKANALETLLGFRLVTVSVRSTGF